MSYDISIFDTSILYDVYSGYNADAITYDSFKVSRFSSTDDKTNSDLCRSVNEEERSFALGMQFVIFRLFGYIPAPILFGNLIDSTCLLWKSTCGSKGGRCLLYDIEQFRYRYVGLCAGIKILALGIFMVDWWLVRRRKHLDEAGGITTNEIVGSIISLDKCKYSDRKVSLLLICGQCLRKNPNPVIGGI